MKLPVQIVFRDMPSSPWLQDLIERRVEKLEQFAPDLMSCHVAIETTGNHHRQGHIYQVRIDLRLTGEELFAGDHHGDEDVAIAVRDAFDAISRRVEAHVQRRRDEVRRVRRERGTRAGVMPDEPDLEAIQEPLGEPASASDQGEDEGSKVQT
jgi:ribosomal subunit interface protein